MPSRSNNLLRRVLSSISLNLLCCSLGFVVEGLYLLLHALDPLKWNPLNGNGSPQSDPYDESVSPLIMVQGGEQTHQSLAEHELKSSLLSRRDDGIGHGDDDDNGSVSGDDDDLHLLRDGDGKGDGGGEDGADDGDGDLYLS
ncbi:hypothetical protein Tco_1119460 [Tanacetum coccineum]